MAPFAVGYGDSGLSPRGTVPTTEPSAAVDDGEFLPRPLKVKTRLVAGS